MALPWCKYEISFSNDMHINIINDLKLQQLMVFLMLYIGQKITSLWRDGKCMMYLEMFWYVTVFFV
jgi:hypothetical protein